MNFLLRNWYISLKRRLEYLFLREGDVSNYYRHGKAMYRFRVLLRTSIKDIFLILIGVLSAGFGLKGFLLPSEFIDGGATGISLLISALGNFNLSVILILVNLPFMYLGYRQ